MAAGRTTAELPALRHAQWNLYSGRTDRVVDYAMAVTRHLGAIRNSTDSTAVPGQ